MLISFQDKKVERLWNKKNFGEWESWRRCSGYYTKQSGGGTLVMELWGTWRISSLPLFLSPLWPRVVIPDRVPSIGQIELVDHLTICKLITDVKLNFLCYIEILETIYLRVDSSNTYLCTNKLAFFKKNSFTYKLFINHMYNHLTVRKQMTDVKLNRLFYIAILETI